MTQLIRSPRVDARGLAAALDGPSVAGNGVGGSKLILGLLLPVSRPTALVRRPEWGLSPIPGPRVPLSHRVPGREQGLLRVRWRHSEQEGPESPLRARSESHKPLSPVVFGLVPFRSVHPDLSCSIDISGSKPHHLTRPHRCVPLQEDHRANWASDTLQYRLDGFPREDVAAVFQLILEEEMAAVVRPYAEQTGLKNLALCGGVFANVKVNDDLHRRLEME